MEASKGIAMRKSSRLVAIALGALQAIAGGLCVLILLAGTAHAAAQLTVTWSDASTNEQGFKLERKTGTAGTYAQITTLPAGTTGYVDSNVIVGTTYCYRARAYNSAGDSAYSNEDCAAPASATLYTVTVGRAGTGSGTVTSSPSGITCGSDCSQNYASGTSVALSAAPAAGSTFTGWSSGCTTVVGTSCTFVVGGAKNLTATFALSTTTTYTLTLSRAGTGSGTITSSPTGISCGTDCSQGYASGAVVTLTAAPAAGSTFTGWGGACTGTTTTCRVTMSGARSATATFAKSATTTTTYTLSLGKSGTGTGTITSSPTGVSCGSDCSQDYTSGTVVTLTAAPAAGSTFTGWTGYWCTGTSPTCRVTMGGARWVGATFAKPTP